MKALQRLKSKKGISGVMVALLLVVVGVALVVGVKEYLDQRVVDMESTIDTSLEEMNITIQ